MQLGQAQVVRSNWYDRAILFDNEYFSGDYSNHALTERFSYTVPPNRSARIVIPYMHLTRDTITAATAVSYLRYGYTPDGGAEQTLILFRNSVGSIDIPVQATPGFIGNFSAGDEITLSSFNSDVGGVVIMGTSLCWTEYDA